MSPSRQNKNEDDMPSARARAKAKRTNNKRDKGRDPRALVLSPSLLKRFALPQPDDDDDKEERGRVLVVGGAAEMPGAVILAATAALRAGAGKLQIATARSISQLVAASVPEARVFALPETRTGALAVSAAESIAERANRVQAVLIGPGMVDEEAVARLLKALLPLINGPTLILDAAALACVSTDAKCLHGLKGEVVLTPHAGEMASMLGEEKAHIAFDPLATARRAAHELRAVVALKGAKTYIAAPGVEEFYCNQTGNVGLATSGSGDTLSGIIVGLAARGARPLQATIWGVYLHGSAGDSLAKRMGRLGFLARELLAEVPLLMSKLDGARNR
jgi:ADP-dependent NAD(P)H-hydrate dehydratase